MRIRPLLVLSAVGLILFASCRDPKIRSYRIAKEAASPAVPPGMSGLANATISPGAAPGIHWQKPEAWQEQPGKSMRIGSFLIPGADGRKAEVAAITLLWGFLFALVSAIGLMSARNHGR